MEGSWEIETARAAGVGDIVAQEAIVRAYYEKIHRLARHLSRNHVEAQDLAQQTLLKACKHAGRFDGRTTLQGWIVGILLHEYSHWRRSRRLFVELKEHFSPDPSRQILDREVLLNAIHRLPKQHCETFLLVEVHGLSVGEAASALEIPVGTVKSRLSDARAKLRLYLEEPFVLTKTKEARHES
ncbi:MAG TPA: RNA polymerase sigma factor [Fimbriimonas sp.]|nr:RNA polymerase sigma factor [Fimbriimonas sp.]